jgi:uncharacterized protein (DUF2461 family)
MEQLLQDVADEFGEAKLFRPNRDTRFSKDKSPYKTNIAAVIYLEKGGSVYVSLAAEGLTSAAARTTSSGRSSLAARASTTTATGRRSRQSSPTCARPRPSSPPTTR